MIIVKGEVRFGDGEIDRLRPDFAANIAATRSEHEAHYLRNMLGGDPPAGD
jgi:hypothetical protein